MKRLAIGAGIAVMGVLALSSCSTQGEGAPASTPTVSSSPTAEASPPDLDKYERAPEGAIDEDTGEVIEPQPSPTWDDGERVIATARAGEAMLAFAGKYGRDYDTWWARLSPLLSKQAQLDYAHVDPTNVPATRVLGAPAPRILDETSGFVVIVEVPTDVGPYEVTLTREDAAAPWLASRFTPPDGDDDNASVAAALHPLISEEETSR